MTNEIKHPAAAFSIPEFCAQYKISRGSFYNLEKAGLAPATFRVGRRVLISVEAATAWRKAMENRTAA